LYFYLHLALTQLSFEISSICLLAQQIKGIHMLLTPIARFDLNVSLRVLTHPSSQLMARISRSVSHTGDGPLYVLLAAFVLIADQENGKLFVICALMAFLLELPLYWVIKNGFKRRRPAELCSQIQPYITPSDRYSLPSGHTAAAMVMAIMVNYFYPSFGPLALVWASAIGVSRVLLGVHFISDVLLGASLGSACAIWVLSSQ
jgi:undecaprenyl-diphosphatase